MKKTEVDINLAAVQIMWLFLLMRITVINQSVWIAIELVGCIVCTAYAAVNIKYIKKRALLLVILFACSYLVSSLVNRPYNGPYITFMGLKFAWKTFIFFTVPWIAIRKRGSTSVAQASWNCLMLYWIPSVISVLIQRQNVMDNANNIYFIGNKFQISYLNVVMLCLYLFLKKGKIDGHRFYFTMKLNKNKVKIFLFCIAIIYLALFMKAYTGLFMILFVLVLEMLSGILQFKFNKRWTGFFSLVNKPFVMVVSVVLSGIITIVLEAIMNTPIIMSFLKLIGKTGNIFSRTLIYKNLIDIISQKPWIGYGYGSAIVSEYFGPNAQNGLAQVVIYTGILGVLLMLAITFYCGKSGRKNSETFAPLLFAVYSFILSATVEITYAGFFFILLAFYSACGWEEKVSKESRLNE